MGIAELLKGVRDAATNPLAFVAYIAAVIAWAILRWRVDRNKNLLDRLDHLPEHDRASVIRDEMGIWDAGEQLTAEQRVRARTHLYYLYAFLVLCAVVVVLFAIAHFQPKQSGFQPTVESKAEGVKEHADPELLSFTRKIESLELGVTKDFVTSNFGQPSHHSTDKGVGCFDYKTAFAKFLVLFDKGNRVTFIYVVSGDSNFKPFVLSRERNGATRDSGRLGNFSFEDSTAENAEYNADPFDIVPDTVEATLGGSRAPARYAERIEYAPATHATLYLVRTDEGFESQADLGAEVTLMHTLEERWVQTNSFWAGVSHNELIELNHIRALVKPNAYAWAGLRRDATDSGVVINKDMAEFFVFGCKDG